MRASLTLRATLAGVALFAFWPLRPGLSGLTLRTARPHLTLRALRASLTLRATLAGVALHPARSHHALRPTFSGFSGVTLRPLRAGLTLRAGVSPQFSACNAADQLLPRRRPRLRQDPVLCAGVFAHVVVQVGAGHGALAVAPLKGHAAVPGPRRHAGRHVHHAVFHQHRRRRISAGRVPERPDGHPVPLAGRAHPHPVDPFVFAVAQHQRVRSPRQQHPAAGDQLHRQFDHLFFPPYATMYPSSSTSVSNGTMMHGRTVALPFPLFTIPLSVM